MKKLLNLNLSLTFDDVLIKPKKSDVLPQSVDLSVKLKDNIVLKIPVLSAAMDTVTELEMARTMIKHGGCGPIHKNLTIETTIKYIEQLKKEFSENDPIAVAVGVQTKKENIKQLINSGANILIVDSAHGHSENVGNLVSYISSNYPNIFIIAGNVVTKEGAQFLVNKGAHAIKVGIGPGSICITRKVTGVGAGQLSAIMEVSEICKKHNVLTVADGGIKSQDDIVKALAAGSDLVMLGYMLAGSTDTPGKVIKIKNKNFKLYRGMGSINAMKNGSKDRYNKSDLSMEKWVPEGVDSYIKEKGETSKILFNIQWSLRSAFGYLGAKNILYLHKNAEFVQITRSVLKKSNFHSIDKIIEDQE